MKMNRMNGKRLNRILSLVLALILTLLLMLPDGVFVYQAESVASQEDAEQLIPTAAPASDTPAVADPEPVSAETPDFTVGEAPDAEIPSNDEPAIEASHEDDESTAMSGFVLGMDAEAADPLHAEWRSLPRYGVVGQAFPFEIEVTGGVAPYTYVLIDGDSRRTITEFSATPNHAGVYELRLMVTDAEGEIAELNTSILVSDNLSETREQWEKSLGDFVPTGDWAADLVAVAETQLGYRRSDVNFIINETGEVCGYTRYGDWAEDPYGEWNAAFAAFCLEYAGIDKADFPRAGDCAEWKAALGDLYVEDVEYAPKPGDLVFLHKNGEAETEDWSAPDHVGIVTRVEDGAVYAIEGNAVGEVRENRYDLSDPAIVGFADMEAAQPDADGDDPEGEPEDPNAEQTEGEPEDPNAEQAEGEPVDQNGGEAEEKTEGEGEPAALRRVGIATGKRVNVRQEATTDSDVVAKLNKGDEVEVLDETEADGAVWYRVRLEEGEGYVHGKYLDVREEPVEEPAEPAEGEIQEDQSGEELPEDETELPPEDDPDLIPADERELPIYVYTLYENVNILEAAQEDSPVVALLETAGERLDVMDAVELEDATWYRVRFGEIEGYVSGDMVDFEPDTVLPAFDESATIGNVTVSVSADAGVFPAGAMLSVARASRRSMSEIEGVLDQERAAEVNIAASYTFDIKVLDADGSELEFANDQRVRVSFSAAEVENINLDTQVYHITEADGGELTAEALEVETEGETAVVLTDGFSYYTVEFTYGKMQYVMQGDSTVTLREIMDYVGLVGEPTAVEVSNPELFSASNETGEWLVTAHQAFNTDEWMKITVSGVDFEIDTVYEFLVTDAVPVFPDAYSGGNSNVIQGGDTETFLQYGPPATICIDKSKIENISPTPYIPAGSSFSVIDGESNSNGYNLDNLTGKVGYVGSLDMGSETAFTGANDWFSYRFSDAAILPDGTRADIILKYSDIHIYTPRRYRSADNKEYAPNRVTYNNLSYDGGCTSIANGARLYFANNVNVHIGIKVKATFSVVEKGTDTPVSGSVYFTMYDIDVKRDNDSNYAYLYGADDNFNFSEQVTITSGALSEAYVPAAENFKIGIVGSGDGNGNGLRFVPAKTAFSDKDPGSFQTGFGVLVDSSGFSVTVSGAAGSYTGQQPQQRKWNSIQSNLLPDAVGALYAEKEVLDNGVTTADLDRDWTVDISISGQTATETIKNDEEPKHIGNFIKGKEFRFYEYDDDIDNYETTYEVMNGSSIDKKYMEVVKTGDGSSADGTMVCVNSVKFINKRLWKDLTIGKTVSRVRPGDEGRKWEFTLTVKDSDQNGNVPLTGLTFPNDMDWAELGNGVYTFKLADGENTTISLPKGCRYTIEEETDPDYSQSGTVTNKELDDDTEEAIVNRFIKNDLTVRKTVDGSMGSKSQYFKVTIALKDCPLDGDYVLEYGGEASTALEDTAFNTFAEGETNPTKITVAGGEGTVSLWLRHGGTVTLKQIPTDTKYTVSEESGGYSAKYVIGSGMETNGTSTGEQTFAEDIAVGFTNTKDADVPTGIRGNGRLIRWSLIMVVALLLAMNVTRRKRYE